MKLKFFYIINLLSQIIFVQTNPQISSNLHSQQDEDKPYIMKGWLKFFTYTSSFYASKIPNKFDYNPAYEAQFGWGRKPTFTEKDKDQFGWFNIIDDTHFFFVLTKTTLYAVYARRVLNYFFNFNNFYSVFLIFFFKNDIGKTYKSIELKWIEPTTTGGQKGPLGGLEDLGNYLEGFCFKLKSKTNVIWNLCADALVHN